MNRSHSFPLLRAITADKFVRSRLLNVLGVQILRMIVARALLKARHKLRRSASSEPGFEELKSEGLLVLRNFLPRPEFEALRAEVMAVLDDPGVAKSDLHHGDTIVRRVYIESCRDRLARADALTSSPTLLRILGAVEGREVRPERELRVVERVIHGDPAVHDPENDLHIDTFHSTHKLWFYLDDVRPESGPLAVVPRSHRLDGSLLRRTYRYFREITRSGNSPSRRIESQELTERGLQEVTLSVPANTLVIANTGGYHRRTRGVKGAMRTSLHVSVRTQPFLYWVDATAKSEC